MLSQPSSMSWAINTLALPLPVRDGHVATVPPPGSLQRAKRTLTLTAMLEGGGGLPPGGGAGGGVNSRIGTAHSWPIP